VGATTTSTCNGVVQDLTSSAWTQGEERGGWVRCQSVREVTTSARQALLPVQVLLGVASLPAPLLPPAAQTPFNHSALTAQLCSADASTGAGVQQQHVGLAQEEQQSWGTVSADSVLHSTLPELMELLQVWGMCGCVCVSVCKHREWAESL
jgi:hypothetical protein